ncbi:MAG: AAA family ATPase [Planctomycetota bacterium]|nr:MAG: AAA family ATPase [Planctomycetota bacterium]
MSEDIDAADKLAKAANELRKEVGKVIVGQGEVIDQLLISLFSGSHCFMVGVPGLAKTLLVSTLAKVLNLSFKRIQFTPDLMPSDITGTDIMQENPETGARELHFTQGPIFSNMVLADEINRTPPKTQAALLEAMQEKQVTAGRKTYQLEPPFFVLATQNPLEQEGTYPLPEAQLDRFMLSIFVDYPDEEDELEVLKRTTVKMNHDIKEVLTAADIIELQDTVKKVPVGDHVFKYALDIVRKTRPKNADSFDFVKEWLEVGAGPRAGQNLILGAKARALMEGRFYATCEDVEFLALPVLRHRLATNFNAESEGVTTNDIIKKILEKVEKPGNVTV